MDKKERIKALAIFFIVGFLVLGKVLGNGFVGDDLGYINHPYIKNFQLTKLFIGSSSDLGGSSLITGLFYRPLMLLVFSLIYTVFGPAAGIYHLFQLTLHIINTYLIFIVLKKFSSFTPSLFLSLIYLVHPINVETVVYISNLQDILFVFWGMLAINIFIKEKLNNSDFGIGCILLFLSMLSKETGVLFFIITFMYLKYAKKIRNVFWIFLVPIIFGYLRFFIANVGLGDIPWSPIGQLSLTDRLLHIPYLIFYYFKTLVYPINLALGQTWIYKSGLPEILILLFFIIPAGIITVFLSRRLKSFGLFFLWFILGIFLHLQIIPLEMTVADRWFYFPFIGLLGMADIIINEKKSMKINKYVCLIVLLIFSLRSFNRIDDWSNAIGLYQHDIQITESYLLEHSLGYELMSIGDMNGAFFHLEKSVKMFSTPVNTNSMGVYYFRKNDIPNSLSWFEKSITLGDYYLAYQNYARLAVTNIPKDKTIKFLIHASQKFPKSDLMQFLLAITEYQNGDYDKALDAAIKAYSISPSSQNLYILDQIQNRLPIKIQAN